MFYYKKIIITGNRKPETVLFGATIKMGPILGIADIGPILGNAVADFFGGLKDPAGEIAGVQLVQTIPVVLPEGTADGIGHTIHHAFEIEIIYIHGAAQAMVRSLNMPAVMNFSHAGVG